MTVIIFTLLLDNLMDLGKLILQLKKDQDYHELEKHEEILKEEIKELLMEGKLNDIVQLTHQLGMLLKYKPYGVKCANLLGYSIFLLNPNEGFSFQRHLDFKVELFHCLQADSNSYAFVMDSDDFEKLSKEDSIEKWWQTEIGPFGLYKKQLHPGDIIKVERPGVVHTVIGAVIEEYANTSIDMVDRLFDQNKGRKTIIQNRNQVLEKISQLPAIFPHTSYQLNDGELDAAPIEKNSNGITTYLLHESPEFSAERIQLPLNSHFMVDTKNQYVSLFTFSGNLKLIPLTEGINTISLGKAETVILPPGTHWEIESESESDLSFLKIDGEKAFV